MYLSCSIVAVFLSESSWNGKLDIKQVTSLSKINDLNCNYIVSYNTNGICVLGR